MEFAGAGCFIDRAFHKCLRKQIKKLLSFCFKGGRNIPSAEAVYPARAS